MDEFARSRYRLESRYHHVLVDEFQDTSRAQWELVEQLVRSWGEGLGAAAGALPPSIFIVGDRKQSIYGFRDAESGLLDEAARFIDGLREGQTRRAISVSFRAAPPLLAFVNDLFDAIGSRDNGPRAPYAFRYEDTDRFPVPPAFETDRSLGIVVGGTVREAADRVAGEIARLLQTATVRDKITGIARAPQPADIAILFRSRDSHREFEDALQRHGVQTYVYKGLGFFEADEIQDAVSAFRYLADPASNLRAAAFLRSRLIRLSDRAVTSLAPELASAILGAGDDAAAAPLGDEDRAVLARARVDVARWLTLVDRVTPSELLDSIFADTA